jgi:hypothetical protein
MKRTTICTFAALMGLAVLAPLAATADECRRDYVVRPCREEVRIEYRRDDHDRDFRADRDHVRVERVRSDHDRRDRR